MNHLVMVVIGTSCTKSPDVHYMDKLCCHVYDPTSTPPAAVANDNIM